LLAEHEEAKVALLVVAPAATISDHEFSRSCALISTIAGRGWPPRWYFQTIAESRTRELRAVQCGVPGQQRSIQPAFRQAGHLTWPASTRNGEAITIWSRKQQHCSGMRRWIEVTIDPHEIPTKSFARQWKNRGVKAVAAALKVSSALVYKWCEAPAEKEDPEQAGAKNPLDRGPRDVTVLPKISA